MKKSTDYLLGSLKFILSAYVYLHKYINKHSISRKFSEDQSDENDNKFFKIPTFFPALRSGYRIMYLLISNKRNRLMCICAGYI